MKVCRDCGLALPLDSFYPTTEGRGGRLAYCKPCSRRRFRDNHNALKLRIIAAYGDCCYCCGITEPAFLCLDHIFGDGFQDGKRGRAWWLRLEREGYPDRDRLRISCHNCNQARQINGGICPHEQQCSRN